MQKVCIACGTPYLLAVGAVTELENAVTHTEFANGSKFFAPVRVDALVAQLATAELLEVRA